MRYTPFGKIKAHGGKKHADLYLCFRGNVCPDGKTKAGAAARAGRHCKGDPCQHLLQRPAHQARQRAPGGARHHGRARDGGHRRRSGQCGDQCETRRPGDGERGDLLRRVLFLQKRLCEQLHRSKRRLGAGLPHRRRAGRVCPGALCGSGTEQDPGRRHRSAGAAGGRCAGHRLLGGTHFGDHPPRIPC